MARAMTTMGTVTPTAIATTGVSLRVDEADDSGVGVDVGVTNTVAGPDAGEADEVVVMRVLDAVGAAVALQC